MFETLTRAHLRDCFKEGDEFIFVTEPGHIAKAIGKQGVNVKKISHLTKKDVKIFEYNEDPATFLKNVLRMNVHVKQEENKLIVECPDVRTKGAVYGRERERLKKLLTLVKRYFSIDEIVVR